MLNILYVEGIETRDMGLWSLLRGQLDIQLYAVSSNITNQIYQDAYVSKKFPIEVKVLKDARRHVLEKYKDVD